MKILKKLASTSLVVRILAGLVVGAILGLVIPIESLSQGNYIALLFWAVILGIALKRNPYPLILYCMKRSALTAFFTRSSAANIPVNMELCKDLGLNEEMYSVSIPLGSTINMDGAAVVITTLTLVAAHTTGVKVSLPMAILLSIVATLSACGTSGVAGGSLLLVPLGCSMFGIPSDIAMQMVGIGLTAEFRSWLKEGKELPL